MYLEFLRTCGVLGKFVAHEWFEVILLAVIVFKVSVLMKDAAADSWR